MEKKLILVGLGSVCDCTQFMDCVVKSLRASSVNVAYGRYNPLTFATPHTNVLFVVCDGGRPHIHPALRRQFNLVDAIFGTYWTCLLDLAKADAVICERDRIGLVDYICQVEREASESHETLKIGEAVCEGIALGLYDRELAKRYLNSVYGKEIFRATLPPRNGKTYTCLKYLEREMFKELEEKNAMIMNNVMNDIARGNPVYLVTESGRVPVRIESLEMSTGEATCFEGRVLTPAEDYVRCDIKCTNDLSARIAQTRALYNAFIAGKKIGSGPRPWGKLPDIKNVHFSGPCTVVIWEDKTKTIVRCKDGEVPDYEKGLAMAIAKKAMGTNGTGSNYYDIFKKWLPKPEEEV